MAHVRYKVTVEATITGYNQYEDDNPDVVSYSIAETWDSDSGAIGFLACFAGGLGQLTAALARHIVPGGSSLLIVERFQEELTAGSPFLDDESS